MSSYDQWKTASPYDDVPEDPMLEHQELIDEVRWALMNWETKPGPWETYIKSLIKSVESLIEVVYDYDAQEQRAVADAMARDYEEIEKWPEEMKDYEKPITVICSKCGRLNEKDTKFIDIAEDIQGADVLTFKCPHCGETRKSRRYG